MDKKQTIIKKEFNMKNVVKLSQFLCLILRHHPEEIDLKLDSNGWANTNELIKKVNTKRKIDLETLEYIVENDKKQRYSFNKDKSKIRANYGHSIPVNPDYEISSPENILYHGTATRFLDSILKSGILSKGRNLVHLSTDIETAKIVGARHGKPIVLEINTKNMERDGYKFYKSMNGIWLTDEVPVKYISIVQDSK